ncbi:2-oxoacid:acceptor oxidoreductase subunit alpha [Ramlibacter tataouinensis]|uniref:2-oxoacid:acceptor oxidoreductase subunit alpha n=1 Tax=Ramlibacter tataouinensis TaxID=94132 RepID=UPI0022F3D9D3|nr:2-oxoacid:acceptor oxidoreductase subunit alpha [Ramlibacter tataouinensis]WBY03201.1 2-oxoacid:acceptor oxidoreductase subunit alpha [Ramlibacter tataouinensis]
MDASITTEQPARAAPAHRLDSVSLAIAGSGGSGVMTAGTWLLDAAARSGLYGLMVRTSGPQIRGGEAAALLRLGTAQLESLDDAFDVLLAIDWQNVHRFADEIPLRADGLLVCDADAGEVPEVFRATGAKVIALPLKKMAKAHPGSWINMLALGITGTLAGLAIEPLEDAVRAGWKRDGEVLQANLRALRAGAEAVAAHALVQRPPAPPSQRRWLLSGNEAAGFGALRGGVRFVAAYPITPATELLEWMAPALAQAGGCLLQAEDELASINMIIGASFGGVPSLTATAGPGLALMTEGIGLAVAAEVPIVVVDVMRGGPSTGIPAKSEQSDLSFAVGGLHGDAPRLVLAPTSISDCAATTQWAVELAEALQAPAIVLSDQFMGQSRAIVAAPELPPPAARRLLAEPHAPDYKRYRDTPSGVSPMAIPGAPGTTYTADGLEHTEAAIPSSQARDHARQLDKRLRKLTGHDYGARWADIEGDGPLAVITFGSASGPVHEAARRAAAQGVPLKRVTLRLLAPLEPELLAQALAGVERVMVVEQNHGAQLLRYLRGIADLPHPHSFHKPGPLPLRPAEICAALVEWAARQEQTA